MNVQVTKEEYGKIGGKGLVEHLRAQLESKGRRPYIVPLGGSNSIGTWGYIQAVQEIVEQAGKGFFTDIVMVSIKDNAKGNCWITMHAARQRVNRDPAFRRLTFLSQCHGLMGCPIPLRWREKLPTVMHDSVVVARRVEVVGRLLE
jgi:hypothetical protein